MKARINKGAVNFINTNNQNKSANTLKSTDLFAKSKQLHQLKPLINKSQYLPLAQVELSAMCFNKMLLSKALNVRTKEYEDFKDIFYAMYFGNKDVAERILKHYPNRTDWKDLYSVLSKSNDKMKNLNVSLIMCLEWSKDKQVFKFDRDFLDELTATEGIMFKKDMLDYLPFKNFYVDLEELKMTARAEEKGMKIDGLFINVVKNANKYHIQVSFVNKMGYTYSDIIVENTDYEIESKNLISNNNVLKTLLGITVNQSEDEFKIEHNYWDNIILQILTYLCSSKPDIQESEETKRTYKKPDINVQPKNKFSEIQKWEVGVRYGVSIRQWKKEKTTIHEEDKNNAEPKQHYKPHYRRGHWHSYWCNEIVDGKKIKRLVPKWLSPILVNKNLCDDVDVVIHKN